EHGWIEHAWIEHRGVPRGDRGGRGAGAHREIREDGAGPGRGAGLPGRVDPRVAADGVVLPAGPPVPRQLHEPAHEDGAGQPRHRLLPREHPARRDLRGPRPPRDHGRPELPGPRRRLHAELDPGRLDGVRRPGARDRPGRHLRAQLRAGGSRWGRSAPRRPAGVRPDARHPRGVRRLGGRAAQQPDHPPSRHARAGDPAPDHRGRRQAVRRRGEDAHRPDQDVVRLPGVVLPQRAGEHPDRAAAHARRAELPVVLGRPLRPPGRRGDRDHGAARGGAVPRLPARHRLVHLAGLRGSPDFPEPRSGAGRPGRDDPHRRRRARPRRRELGGADRPRPWLPAVQMAAAGQGPGGRPDHAGGQGRRRGVAAAVPRAEPGFCRAVAGAHRRPPDRRGAEDAGL
ncbi:MAG: FIG00822712: hypothetical protein, partial [uncultured Nocardioidaceae bacterium]